MEETSHFLSTFIKLIFLRCFSVSSPCIWIDLFPSFIKNIHPNRNVGKAGKVIVEKDVGAKNICSYILIVISIKVTSITWIQIGYLYGVANLGFPNEGICIFIFRGALTVLWAYLSLLEMVYVFTNNEILLSLTDGLEVDIWRAMPLWMALVLFAWYYILY